MALHVPTQALEVEEKKELKTCESGVNGKTFVQWKIAKCSHEK